MTDELPKKKRFAARPLLVASGGLAVIALGLCGTTACGNLLAPTRCPDGSPIETGCPFDAGTPDDAGSSDGGTLDAGP
jgi:hypothetical protein